MLQRKIHKLEVLEGCPFVVFETHDTDENDKEQHLLAWFTKFNNKFYGDFIELGDGTDIPELVEMQEKQALQTLKELQNV